MVVKKKPVKHTHTEEEKEHVSVEESSKEERRPPITQVVEVVEDSEDSDTLSASAAPETGGMLEEEASAAGDENENTPAPKSEESEEIEKRRVLVDELFQKKDGDKVSEMVPEISMHKRPSTKPAIMWAIVIVVTCLVAGGAILLVAGGNLKMPSIGAKPTPTPTATAAPTPTPVLETTKKEELSIQVLNGSGTPGEAGKMKTFLEKKGYTVKDTGNADNYDYEATEIQIKSGKEAIYKLLETDLKEDYNLSSSPATLSDDVPYDVRIVVGKEQP